MRGGGIRHLGESPSSPDLRPHGPWRTGEIRGPGPTSNVSFVFIYDFGKRKSRKNWKQYFCSNRNDQKKIFLVQK